MIIPKNQNSHILIPNCILKQFEDKQHSLHCFDVVNKKYCLRHPKTIYTELNHYSNEVEKFLSNEIETPIGTLIKKLKMFYDNCQNILITPKEYQVIKSYVYSLASRSQKMKEEIKKNLIFSFYTQQNINDISAVNSFRLIKNDDFLKDFFMTFMFIEGNDEFILPLCGYCSSISDMYGEMIFVPLTPKIALFFYKKNNIGNHIMFPTEQYVDAVNNLSFKMQVDMGDGYVMGTNKKNIEQQMIKEQTK